MTGQDKPATIAGIISISEPLSYPPHPLDRECRITAKGFVDEYQVQELHNVRGRVNLGEWVTGTVYAYTWTIPGLGRAGTYYSNRLEVQAEVTLIGGGGIRQWTDLETRNFTATGGYNCEGFGYGYGSFVQAGAQRPTMPIGPIGTTLPRYYRILAMCNGTTSGPDLGVQSGGLLQRSAVYLAYNSLISTPHEAVWQDINLPELAGRWTLRVWSNGGKCAELSFSQVTANEVPPPLVFPSSQWNPNGCNLLSCDARFPGLENQQVVFQVEPA